MKLTHFHNEEFKFNPAMKYAHFVQERRDMNRPWGMFNAGKPFGMILSDERKFGWSHWCEEEGGMELGDCRTDYFLDTKDILVFNENNKNDLAHLPLIGDPRANPKMDVDWGRVAGICKGIYITGRDLDIHSLFGIPLVNYPYTVDKSAVHMGLSFISGWDYNHAIVWDTSCVTPMMDAPGMKDYGDPVMPETVLERLRGLEYELPRMLY